MTNERNLKTHEIPTFELMVERNLAVYALATQDQEAYDRGFNWYPYEHDNCINALHDLASFGMKLDLLSFAKIVGIVSPGRKWKVNIKDAFATALAWHRSGDEFERVKTLQEYKVSRRYGLPAFRRAWSLLDGKYDIVYKKAPKTYSFAHNLTYPDTSPEITVDQHNCHILLGEWDVYGSIGISYGQYIKLAPTIQHCADLLGLPARTFQAILWVWRVENVGVEVDLF